MKQNCPDCGRFLEEGWKEAYARKKAFNEVVTIRLFTQSCQCGFKRVEDYHHILETRFKNLKPY